MPMVVSVSTIEFGCIGFELVGLRWAKIVMLGVWELKSSSVDEVPQRAT